MIGFLARRLAQTALLLATVALASFCVGEWAPGKVDPAVRLDAHYSADAVAAIRARNGLDRPVLARFASWLQSVARGSLGTSIEYEAPVAPLVLARAGRTLLLGTVATALAWLIAVPLGVWMAAVAGSAFDRACRAGMTAALAVPEPALALGAVVVAIRTGLAPAGGMWSTRTDAPPILDLLSHLALPAIVLAIGLLPALVRHVRAAIADTLGAGFIVAARARGVPRRRLLFRSALRVAAPPLLSLFGLSIASLLSTSLLVEVITGWPGLGPLLVEATRSRDMPVIAAITVCSCALLAAGGLIADIGVQAADPRVRLSAASTVE